MLCELGFSQAKRPDQFSNLKVWIKADSTCSINNGNQPVDGATIDTVYNWGSLGAFFRNATATQRPIYRKYDSPSTLPSLEFGSTNSITSSLAASNFNFLHNGTANTVVIFIKLVSTGTTQRVLNTNAGSSSNIGFMLSLTSGNKFRHEITKGSSSVYLYDNETTNTFSSTSTYYTVTAVNDLTATPADSSKIRLNGAQDALQEVTDLPYSASNAASSLIIGSTSSNFVGLVYEIAIFDALRTPAELEQIRQYLIAKWTTYATPPAGAAGLAQVEDQMETRWTTYGAPPISSAAGLPQVEDQMETRWTIYSVPPSGNPGISQVEQGLMCKWIDDSTPECQISAQRRGRIVIH
jgi:hypothetical protein